MLKNSHRSFEVFWNTDCFFKDSNFFLFVISACAPQQEKIAKGRREQGLFTLLPLVMNSKFQERNIPDPSTESSFVMTPMVLP